MITLYHCAGSRSVRSLWLLNELGVEFDLKELEFNMETLRGPDYLSIHPLGRVPCLVDGDVTIFESGAINQYLCETYDPDQTLWRAPDTAERADWLQWIHYAETIAVHGAALVQQRVFIKKEERSPAVAELEGRRLIKALGVVNDVLAERDYLLKSGFTAADIGVGYSTYLGKLFIETEELAHLERWFRTLAERPAFKASFPPLQKMG